MLTRKPDYYHEFRCLAGACPHSCCEKWEVVLDEETVARYQQEPGALGEKLRRAMCVDQEGDVCFPLNGSRCPFLDEENLCEIHRQLGQEATSITCREHPRFIEDYGPFREITLAASCPAANALLLGGTEPLRFVEEETPEESEAGDEWLDWLVPLREKLLELLADRTLPLRQRLRRFLMLSFTVQNCLDEEREEEIPGLLESWDFWEPQDAESAVPAFPGILRMLAGLEILEPDWPALLEQAETAPGGPVSQALLERIAVYLGFRYLLKAVNDGDLLGRAQLVAVGVLVVERLASVCGVEEALRRFSCEIEHSEENLEALLRSMWQEECCSLPALLREL